MIVTLSGRRPIGGRRALEGERMHPSHVKVAPRPGRAPPSMSTLGEREIS
jgi:hypothetical protein